MNPALPKNNIQLNSVRKDGVKNVLIVNSTGHVGGAEKILLTFLKKLDRNVFNFFAVIPFNGRFSKFLKDLNIDFEVVEKLYSEKGFVTRDDSIFRSPILTIDSISNLLKFSGKISEFIKRRNVDIVISCGVKASIASGIAAFFNKTPCLWIIQDVLPNNLYGKMFFLWAKILPDKIIVVSNAIKNTFPKSVRDRIDTIYPFLTRQEFSRMKETSSLRIELNIKDDETLLGVIGKLFPSKGVDIFLKAFSQIKKSNPNVKAIITGDADLEVIDPHYMDELKDLTKSLDLEGDVKFIDWQDDIYDVLTTIDILVHTPTRPEGFGRILIEAMAASRPPVAFDQGAIREIIEDGISGVLVEPLNQEDLITKLEDLIHNVEKRKLLGEAARRRVEEHFSELAYENRFSEILREF